MKWHENVKIRLLEHGLGAMVVVVVVDVVVIPVCGGCPSEVAPGDANNVRCCHLHDRSYVLSLIAAYSSRPIYFCTTINRPNVPKFWVTASASPSKVKKGKGRIIIGRYLHSKSLWPAALYNLGSGSWLARANGAAAQIAAIHCMR